MRKKRAFLVGLLVVGALLLRVTSSTHLGRTSADSGGAAKATNSPANATDRVSNSFSSRVGLLKREKIRRDAVKKMQDQWRTPIEFYGKVVDESDQPVQGATVDFKCNDLSVTGTSAYKARSDENGLFSLRGIRGNLLVARVSKEGYYSSKRDTDAFSYAGENINFVPAPSDPVVFHLRKKGTAEALVFAKQNFRVPCDGVPLEIDLKEGCTKRSGEGDLKVQCWTQDAGKRSGEKYDWLCRLTIPGGGLIESTNEFDFLAPESGYQEGYEIQMNEGQQDWKSDVEKRFIYKLPNGTYGRMTFAMIAAGDHFC